MSRKRTPAAAEGIWLAYVPVVAIHTVILYEAICHSCGWSSSFVDTTAAADQAADGHQCPPL